MGDAKAILLIMAGKEPAVEKRGECNTPYPYFIYKKQVHVNAKYS